MTPRSSPSRVLAFSRSSASRVLAFFLVFPVFAAAAELPSPTRTPTAAQLKTAITRDLWAEVQSLRTLATAQASELSNLKSQIPNPAFPEYRLEIYRHNWDLSNRLGALNDYVYLVHTAPATKAEWDAIAVSGQTPAPPIIILPIPPAPALTLTWQDNSADESGFALERALGSGAFAEIARVAADVTTYTDTALLPATEYTYRVRAFNDFGLSAYSNPASAITPPASTVEPLTIPATAYSAAYDRGPDGKPQVDAAGSIGYWEPGGEWVEYAVTLPAPYATIRLSVACAQLGGTIALAVDGVSVATVTIPNTGSWSSFQPVDVSTSLSAGPHIIRLTSVEPGANWHIGDLASLTLAP